VKLRPYQSEAVEAVYRYLREHDDNPCVVIPTAGGKTPVLATICRDAVTRWGGRVAVLAHVKELLEQAADKLRAICPEVSVGIYSAGLKRRDTEQPVIVGGIQSVYKRACDLGAFDLVVIDECFPAGTTVDGRPIEMIQAGDMVRSFNHKTQEIETRPVLAVSSRPKPARMVRITLEDGRQLTSTPNHPFYNGDAYVPANTLVENAVVYVPRMRSRHSRANEQPAQSVRQSRANVLQQGMLTSFPGSPVFDSDETVKSDERSIRPREGVGNDEGQGAQTGNSRREGKGPDASAKTVVRDARPGVDSRNGNQDGPSQTRRKRHVVLGRSGPCRTKTVRRDRRRQPQDTGGPGPRREAQPHLVPVRVDHVEVLEQRHSPQHECSHCEDRVYNLQVEGNENYFAEGVLVHNCHLIPAEGDGMYRQFLADAKIVNPGARLIGLTATPYRMKSGMLCGPDNLLNAVCYEVGVKELIRDGYICPLVTKAGVRKVDTSGLHVRAGEFIGSEVEELMDTDELVEAACREIVERTADRNSCLIFASSIAHARHIQSVLQDKHGVECGFVCGDTPPGERAETLARFKGEKVPANLFNDSRPPLKYLVNVNVLTTGFDAPNIDCVVLLRPTNSPGLYYQMVGRGFRLFPGKENCLVLDFAGNILRHGPVDAIQIRTPKSGGGGSAGEGPAKECPECRSVIACGYSVCPDCGYEFPNSDEPKHDAKASEAGIITGQVTDTEYTVRDIFYSVHTKRGADEDSPKTMRVDYDVGFHDYRCEWVCPEHDGFARRKFVKWWSERSDDPIPPTAERAVDIASAGGLCQTKAITVRSVAGERFDTIINYELGEKPEPVPIAVAMGLAEEEIPF